VDRRGSGPPWGGTHTPGRPGPTAAAARPRPTAAAARPGPTAVAAPPWPIAVAAPPWTRRGCGPAWTRRGCGPALRPGKAAGGRVPNGKAAGAVRQVSPWLARCIRTCVCTCIRSVQCWMSCLPRNFRPAPFITVRACLSARHRRPG